MTDCLTFLELVLILFSLLLPAESYCFATSRIKISRDFGNLNSILDARMFQNKNFKTSCCLPSWVHEALHVLALFFFSWSLSRQRNEKARETRRVVLLEKVIEPNYARFTAVFVVPNQAITSHWLQRWGCKIRQSLCSFSSLYWRENEHRHKLGLFILRAPLTF